MLDMYGIFQSPFKGEMPNPGFGEYFASVRKYSMTLVMGASMFGMSAMLRQYREITVPITVLLVAFGTCSVAIGRRASSASRTSRRSSRPPASPCAPRSAASSRTCRSSGRRC